MIFIVVIYVSRAHCSTKISDITLMEDEIESVFASMISGNKKFIIGCVYRPPHSDIKLFLEKLDNVLSYIRDRHVGCELIMHGDFNINLLSVQSNGLCSDYLSLIYSYNLLPAIL